MDYEKKYKEALQRAKIWQNHLYEIGDKDYADELNYIFPELAESENERIRKNLISCISTLKHPLFSERERKEFIAYLEKQGEQKPAWSEEDEVKINRIVACLENLNVADNDILLKDVDWLKSLRPQNTWKPSEKQIRELGIVATGKGWFDAEILSELLEQLKKLKG